MYSMLRGLVNEKNELVVRLNKYKVHMKNKDRSLTE